MDKKNDIFDALLYASAPYAGKNETEEYDSADQKLTMSPKAKKKMMKRLKRERKYTERHETYRPALEIMKRAAVVVLVIMSIGFAGVISVEASRDTLYDFIIEWYENSIFFKYESYADEIPEIVLEYKEPYPGEDYTRFEVAKSQYIYSIEFERGGETITYNQNLLSHYAFKLADNYSEIDEIIVNGGDGVSATYVIDGKLFTMIMWNDGKYLYRLSGNASKDELIRIAETLN